jgi:hypothetical protein
VAGEEKHGEMVKKTWGKPGEFPYDFTARIVKIIG